MSAFHSAKRLLFATLSLAASAPFLLAAKLPLAATPSRPDDMAFVGPLAGVADGEKRYLSRQALAEIQGKKVINEGILPSFQPVDLTVLPLSALLAEMPLPPGTDALLLVCSDRWESVLPLDFIKQYDPYLLLYYDGKSPEQGWPRFSRVEAFAPYFVNVSSKAHPDFKGVIPEGMISATQVVEMRAINLKAHYAEFNEGAMARLSPTATAGKKIFIQHCNNCHEGPSGVGGNTSQRPFLLLQTHATLNEEYFRKMVQRPKDFFPDTLMPPHNFGEETFGPLITFLKETHPNALANATASVTATAATQESGIAALRPIYDKINPKRIVLTPEEIKAALTRLPGWHVENGILKKLYLRKNFVEAIAFIQALVPECERMDHHPEIITVYNKVSIGLTSYDAANQVSSFDVIMAEHIEALSQRTHPSIP